MIQKHYKIGDVVKITNYPGGGFHNAEGKIVEAEDYTEYYRVDFGQYTALFLEKELTIIHGGNK